MPNAEPKFPQGDKDDLLLGYAKERALRSGRVKLYSLLAAIVYLVASYEEYGHNGTTFLLTALMLVLAVVMTLGFAAFIGGALAWLGWLYAGSEIKRGSTRWHVATLVWDFTFSLIAAAPFGAMGIINDQSWNRPATVYLFFFWTFWGFSTLGYLGRYLVGQSRV